MQQQQQKQKPFQRCGFCQSPLKTITSKSTPFTDYTVCEATHLCPFFTKTSLLEDYCNVLLYRVLQIYKDLPPYCEHNTETASLFLSRTEKNFNRPFFKCGRHYGHEACSYFQWADEDPNQKTRQLNHHRPLPPPLSNVYGEEEKKKEKDMARVKRVLQHIEETKNKKKKCPPLKLTLPKEPKKPRKKKIKTTVLQEGTSGEPGTPCTLQELQSIDQLLENTFDCS